ncbi:hypothetical protein [Streptomyces sp. C8S0]|uniref:phage tail tube protein n=1 Tax=Streptomyces sp. C8S0 TaxID=2585716 RepID=UPI001D05722A|nr:hypothetical protein [Streptomyces sp. C8S0]
MSDVIVDGKTRVYWVTTISSISAPTVAELDAGIDFTERITPDGLTITRRPRTSTTPASRRRSPPTAPAAARSPSS